MDTAWMLRNDGKPFPVEHHIYADPEDPEDILCAAQWLYRHTGCLQVRMLIGRMFALWAWKAKPGAPALDTLVKYASDNEGFFPDCTFIEEDLGRVLVSLEQREKRHPSDEDIDAYYRLTLLWLHQEFLRVRYGGMYDTEKGCGDIFFRISSVGFDWYPHIQGFVGTSELKIKTVTIVRDAESTGAGNAFYRALDGIHFYDRMPVDEFLDERKSAMVPKNHLYYMEGATGAGVRGARAALFEGNLRQGCGLPELAGEIKRLSGLENLMVSGRQG